MAGVWSKFKPQVSVGLYDAKFRALWLSWADVRAGEVAGTRAWEWCAPHDRPYVQAAFAECVAEEKEVTIDADFEQFGRWRLHLTFCTFGTVCVMVRGRRWPDDVQRLTERETEVCYYLGCGLPTKQIASLLDVSKSTVFNLRSSAARRLRISADELCAWSGARLEWLGPRGTSPAKRSRKR